MDILRTSRGVEAAEPRRRQAGFSLIELQVALVILAFVALSVFGALDYGMTLNGSSRDYTTVNNLAKSRLEQLVALPFNAPQLVAGTVFTEVTPDGLFDLDYVVRDCAIASYDMVPLDVSTWKGPLGTEMVDAKVVTLTVSARGVAPGIRSVTVEAVKHIR